MKNLLTILIFILSTTLLAAEEASEQSLRSKIGPTVRSPLFIENHFYFLSAGGVLIKANYKFENEKILFQTKLPTASPIYQYGDLIIFGEGLHNHNESSLYIYNLKKEKLVKKIEVNGHVQRAPLVYKDLILVGTGPDGLHAYDRKSYEFKWKINKHESKSLHVDSNPIAYKDKICFTSVYESKLILCSNLEGKVIKSFEAKENPKGELSLVKNKLLTLETEADMMKLKFDIPSLVKIINLDNLKIEKEIKLRGFNFFRPLDLNNDEVMYNLSTGDMITINITNGKIGYIGEFPEPFVSTPFILNSSVCSLGLMGKLICKEKAQDQYVVTKEKRFFESIVGEVTNINGRIYAASRMGYFIFN